MGRVFEKRKHKIFARNAKLSKLFTRIGKEIAMAVKSGGPNPDANTRLRMAIQNARGMNMPKEIVDRAIKKAAGGEGVDIAETTYEGYAPGGIAIFVDVATNNTTRTVANVRSFFTKCEGSLGTSGSLSHVFERKAEFVIENAALKGKDGDELFHCGLYVGFHFWRQPIVRSRFPQSAWSPVWMVRTWSGDSTCL